MRARGTAATAAAVAGFMTMTGCGVVGDTEAVPVSSRVPLVPFTKDLAAGEIASLALLSGLPDGDTSASGTPAGDWRKCAAPWLGEAPAAGAAGAFEATVMRLRQHDWEIVSSHAEKDVTYRTLAKRGWKIFARYYAVRGLGPGQIVSLNAVEDGCELPAPVRADYADPA